jgi:hypothetical protein
MRRKNQKKGTKQFERKIKKLIFILILLYVGQGVVKGMFSERTVTFYNTAQAEEAETIELPNPCALEVVECAGERMSTSSDVSLASGNKGQLSPQRLNADGTGAKTEKEEANISRMVNASSIETLIRNYFPEDPETAIAIAKAESGLDPRKPSTTDITRDGHVYSHGLFQINLTVSNIDGVPCNQAFDGKNNGSTIKDTALYKKCVKLAQDPIKNLNAARLKYEGRKNTWGAWGAFLNESYKRHL